DIVTAAVDKFVFDEVVKDVAGEQMNTATLSSVTDETQQPVEAHKANNEPVSKLDSYDMASVLTNSGIHDVSTEKIESTVRNTTDDETDEFKTQNIVPKYTSKSIKIETKAADLKVSPQNLKYIRQVNLNGKLCLVLELDENAVIDGFEMIP